MLDSPDATGVSCDHQATTLYCNMLSKQYISSIRYTSWICILWFFHITCYGQLYHFERFGFEDGMPHTEVNDVIQGPDYRIYAATEEGLAVYDGSEFEVYTRKDRLDSDDIHLLFSDMEGRVWIASSNGGLNYLYQDSIYQPTALKQKLKGFKVYEIFQRADSTLLFVTESDVLAAKKDTAYSLWDQYGLPAHTPTRRIATLFQDSILYINMTDHSYLKVDINSGEWHWLNNKKPFNETIHSMRINQPGRLFMNGNPGLVEFRNDTLYKIHKNLMVRCWDMDFDDEGNLWLYSEGNGFGKYNPTDDSFQGFDSKSGLPSQTLFGGTIDHESNVWLASYDEGLIRFRDQSLMKFDVSNGIPKDAVNKITNLGDTLYLATRSGVVRMVNETIVDTLLSDLWTWSVFSNEQYVLAGTVDGPYHIYTDGRIEKKPYRYSHDLHEFDGRIFSLNSVGVYCMQGNRSDTLETGWVKEVLPLDHSFVFMLDDAIMLYNDDSPRTLVEMDANKLGSFRSMTRYNGDVYIKSDKHIHRVREIDQRIEVEAYDISSIPEIAYVNAMDCTGDTLWLSGPGQFIMMQLPSLLDWSKIQYIRFPINSSSIRTAIKNNGIIAHGGKVYGISSTGLVVFDPNKYKFNRNAPKLNLLDVKLFGRSLSNSRTSVSPVEFDVSENNISFLMGASTFANGEYTAFKYRLLRNGRQSTWIGPTRNNEVVFSSLNDGVYQFEFIANNGQGVWNKTPYKFLFNINKPFWKKSIFWILCLSIFGLLFLLFKLYENKIRLSRQKKAREKLIEIQEQERQRIARELHDSVGQKIMLLAIKAKEIDAPEINMLALSSLEETRAISQGLHPVVLDQLGLTDGLKDMLTKIDEFTELFIDFSIEPVDHLIEKEHHIHVFRIVQELVTNTLKHAKATTCSIAVRPEQDMILVVVEDNGRGFEMSKQNDGLGLRSILDRVALLGAKIDLKTTQGTKVTVQIPKVHS